MTQTQDWLKKVTPEIFETLSLSDSGSAPAFPVDDFVNSLKESLKLEDLSISTGKMGIIEEDSFFRGLGQKTLSTPLALSPLDGIFHFVMGIDDIKTLISFMEEGKDETPAFSLEDESIVKGVYTYFMTEAIDSIMALNIYKDLSLKISDGAITSISAFAIDITISVKGAHLLGRIIIPNDFYKAFQSHFTFIPPTLDNLENIIDVSIPLSIHTGSVSLTEKELKELEEGDFLLLHNSFYSPSKKKGSFQMRVGRSPLFQVKKQKDGIKILDYLYFYNEENMDENEENPPIGDKFEDDFTDFDEDLDDVDEFDETSDDLDKADEELDEQIQNEAKAAAEPLPEEAPPPPIDEKDTELEVDESFVAPEKTNLSEIPLTIQMEIARFTISLEELKKMSPGFKLPVNINPAQVNLMISGKSIGTGEIIEIGDAIGVKITSLNK